MSDNLLVGEGIEMRIDQERFEQICNATCHVFIPSSHTQDDLILFRQIIIKLCDDLGLDKAKRNILDKENLSANSFKKIIDKIVSNYGEEDFDGGNIAHGFIKSTLN